MVEGEVALNMLLEVVLKAGTCIHFCDWLRVFV